MNSEKQEDSITIEDRLDFVCAIKESVKKVYSRVTKNTKFTSKPNKNYKSTILPKKFISEDTDYWKLKELESLFVEECKYSQFKQETEINDQEIRGGQQKLQSSPHKVVRRKPDQQNLLKEKITLMKKNRQFPQHVGKMNRNYVYGYIVKNK